jgi:hypothetical protein
MSINEISERKWPVQRPLPNENGLLAAVAIALLILNILVVVTLTPASARGPMTAEEDALARLCD